MQKALMDKENTQPKWLSRLDDAERAELDAAQKARHIAVENYNATKRKLKARADARIRRAAD